MELIENVRIDLADYAAHPENYNEHPDAQVAELMESLRQFGQPRSIVVWRGRLVDGKGLVVAGHGVVEAARRLGWKHLDARRLPDDWPEYKVKAYLAADNELARGASPNMQALAALAEDVRRENETLARLAAGGEEALKKLVENAGETGGLNLDPGEGRYKEQYGVIVICQDEQHQEAVYNDLHEAGYTVRVVVT